ncbi:hypothetical protein J3A83DRAFT_4086567 [Scleroderma citrinum]
MSNRLTRQAGLQLAPVVLETLVQHYFKRVKKESAKNGKAVTQLMQDELLYDEAFNIVKVCLTGSYSHTVEELQAFSNTRTPSPPWVRAVRVLIPVSSCDEAAPYLIQALGGEEHAKRMVGGTKWWQVRGIPGIDGEWMTARKDWQEAKKRHKASQWKKNASTASPPLSSDSAAGVQPSASDMSNSYHQEMDEMRCILYAHGGGYYFGSVDQERYSIQRHARKINGRVFAINYRLAPQYPFPCALHDLLTAYLYLIRPPAGASHQPVNPAYLVVAGDSAGGGLTLALLQVLRDVGLPLPAGGVLISPWCDLTHSFPSLHTNTETDVFPPYGLSLQKPSPLWPPPSYEVTHKVHTKLRQRIRQVVHLNGKGDKANDVASITGSILSLDDREEDKPPGMPINVGATGSLPSVDNKADQTIYIKTKFDEVLTVEHQLQFYAQNSLVCHPLVSPALSYLGGLPPLLIIASDKESLRDEIIYCAHKAADPSQFPLTKVARTMYPVLIDIEKRYGSTPVHLQVYDDTAHVLPVLFGFTTPGKFCYRAIANFIRHVTGMPIPKKPTSPTLVTSSSHLALNSPTQEEPPTISSNISGALSESSLAHCAKEKQNGSSTTPGPLNAAIPASNSTSLDNRSGFFRIRSLRTPPSSTIKKVKKHSSPPETQDSGDLSGRHIVPEPPQCEVRFAGEASVYSISEGHSWKEGMIRERVSTRGEIRPLEPKEQLAAFLVPVDFIGVISERVLRRYIEWRGVFDQKFEKEIEVVEGQRRRNMERAKKDHSKVILHLRELRDGKNKGKTASKDGLDASGEVWAWAWAWALDEDERPPPSCIVSRRDTDEARRLARIADQAVLQDDIRVSGNSLWTFVVNLLSSPSDKDQHHLSDSEALERTEEPHKLKKSRSVFATFRPRTKSSEADTPTE